MVRTLIKLALKIQRWKAARFHKGGAAFTKAARWHEKQVVEADALAAELFHKSLQESKKAKAISELL